MQRARASRLSPIDSRRGIPPHVELRASASAPEANFNPSIEYKFVNLRRLWMSRAVVWDVCGLFVSGPLPRRRAHLNVHFGDDDVEAYRQWVTELREWGDSSLIGLYNATSMGWGGTREYPGNGDQAPPRRKMAPTTADGAAQDDLSGCAETRNSAALRPGVALRPFALPVV